MSESLMLIDNVWESAKLSLVFLGDIGLPGIMKASVSPDKACMDQYDQFYDRFVFVGKASKE
jgi:hypothetical protein